MRNLFMFYDCFTFIFVLNANQHKNSFMFLFNLQSLIYYLCVSLFTKYNYCKIVSFIKNS